MSGGKRECGKEAYDLEFDRLSLQLDSPNLEIDTNCGDVALSVSVVSESKEQARLFAGRSAGVADKGDERRWVLGGGSAYLSDARVADEEEFEEIVVFAGVHGRSDEMRGGREEGWKCGREERVRCGNWRRRLRLRPGDAGSSRPSRHPATLDW